MHQKILKRLNLSINNSNIHVENERMSELKTGSFTEARIKEFFANCFTTKQPDPQKNKEHV